MRVASRVFVDALRRRASAEGAFATIVRAGADHGGAIFVQVRQPTSNTLYGPAMAGLDRDDEAVGDDRRFTVLMHGDDAAVDERMARERAFDPDLWWVEVEDAQGRPFIDSDALRDE